MSEGTGNGWREAVDAMRSRASWADVRAVRREPLLGDLVAAWPAVCPQWMAPEEDAPDDADEALHMLWEALPLDELATAVGVAIGAEWNLARRLVERARDLRLVFPDGSVSETAAEFLEAESKITAA